MTEVSISDLRSTFDRTLAAPAPDNLWQLQRELLSVGGNAAKKAREVAGEFYGFLKGLESKVASRSASRWGAILETASVTSVGLQEMMVEQEDPLRRLLASGLTGALEVAAAVKNVEAWEVEAALVYYDVAWYLYGELWEISKADRPEMSDGERGRWVDRLLEPVMSPEVEGTAKSVLLVRLFLVVLAARMLSVIETFPQSGGKGKPP